MVTRFVLVACLSACATAAPAVRSPAPTGLVRWDAATGVVRCDATGTALSVPRALRAHVRPHGDDVTIVRPGLAVIVRSSRTADAVADFVSDWSALHDRLRMPLPVELEADARIERQRLLLELARADGERYRLAYAPVHRNGASCRIAALATDGADLDAFAVLEGVHDSPAMDFMAVAPKPAPDPALELLRALGVLFR